MIRFKFKNKKYKSTQTTDALVTLFGGTSVIILLDWLISIQENINVFVK
ncbi:TreN-like membrane protein [Staphylococcus phage PG-2021_5]